MRLILLWRTDLVPNYSVNTLSSLSRAVCLPCFPRIPHPGSPSSDSFNQVFNAACQRKSPARTSVPLHAVPPPRNTRDAPNSRSRYLRISASSFGIPTVRERKRSRGGRKVRWAIRRTGMKAGGREQTTKVSSLSFSHGASAIRSSKPTE